MTAAFPPPIPTQASLRKPTQIFVAKARVDLTDRSEVLVQLHKCLRDGAGMKVVHTLNPAICMQSLREPAYADTLNEGDLNVVDGVGLQKLVQSVAGQKVDRICGPT
jgi:UDP-N-acetyl-D-mannosaminuronic acid transferase (WecB/TagA/CpsF family)